MSDRSIGLALGVVRAASFLVPGDRRREWRSAWEGDLAALRLAHERGRRPDAAGSGPDLALRALGRGGMRGTCERRG